MMSVTQNGISYILNEEKHIAKVQLYGSNGDIVIPKSAIHQEQEYTADETISSWWYSTRKIKSVTFADDSQISTINTNSFYNANLINKIVIPSSVKTIGYQAFSNSIFRIFG